MTVINAHHRFTRTRRHGKLWSVNKDSERPAITAELSDDILKLPVEFLRWVALIGPRITALPDDERAEILLAMAEVAQGGSAKQVNVIVGDKNVVVGTTNAIDVHQD